MASLDAGTMISTRTEIEMPEQKLTQYQRDAIDIIDGTYHQDLDQADRYLLVFKAVKVLKEEPEIDPVWFAHKVGLNDRNMQNGLTGWYMHLARQIIKKAAEQGYEL